eukprot:1891760-Prymnesium_polylepis.1
MSAPRPPSAANTSIGGPVAKRSDHRSSVDMQLRMMRQCRTPGGSQRNSGEVLQSFPHAESSCSLFDH